MSPVVTQDDRAEAPGDTMPGEWHIFPYPGATISFCGLYLDRLLKPSLSPADIEANPCAICRARARAGW